MWALRRKFEKLFSQYLTDTMNPQNLIVTEDSALSIFRIDPNVVEMISEVIDDIDTKLIVNPKIVVYGKPATQHRSIGFFSNDSIGYRYSGQMAKSQSLTPILKLVLDYVNQLLSSDYNAILVNRYSDGTDYIGAHSDDETCLDPVGVACISYGAGRKFRIRDKKSKKIVLDYTTKNDELILMSGNFQKNFTHEIPVEKKVRESRYSLTFRKHTQ